MTWQGLAMTGGRHREARSAVAIQGRWIASACGLAMTWQGLAMKKRRLATTRGGVAMTATTA
jgi:hypothetical protein